MCGSRVDEDPLVVVQRGDPVGLDEERRVKSAVATATATVAASWARPLLPGRLFPDERWGACERCALDKMRAATH